MKQSRNNKYNASPNMKNTKNNDHINKMNHGETSVTKYFSQQILHRLQNNQWDQTMARLVTEEMRREMTVKDHQKNIKKKWWPDLQKYKLAFSIAGLAVVSSAALIFFVFVLPQIGPQTTPDKAFQYSYANFVQDQVWGVYNKVFVAPAESLHQYRSHTYNALSKTQQKDSEKKSETKVQKNDPVDTILFSDTDDVIAAALYNR